MTRTAILACILLSGCWPHSADETGDGNAEEPDCAELCGDLDGQGTDTGDLPNVLGSWTSTFGTQVFYENCGVADLDQDSEHWINGVAMEIYGYAPDGLRATFRDEDEEFVGAMNGRGGVIFTGRHQHSAGEMQVAFGGLLYHDVWRDLDVIEGFAYLGLDTTGDGAVDCYARGGWTAIKSGN